MGKVSDLQANEYARALLPDETNRRLIEFCDSHKAIYIFGSGKVGNGMKLYLEQCGVIINGLINSDTFGIFRREYIKGKTGLIIGVSDRFLDEVMPMIKAVADDCDIFLSSSKYRDNIGQRFSTEYVKDNMLVSFLVVSHCNINCKGCRAFSPISRPDFYEYSEFEKDIEQIKGLDLGFKSLQFSGGEPLLHPELFYMFRKARELYLDKPIQCLTNGTLLGRLSDEQLNRLIELDIVMHITKYPVGETAVDLFCRKADKMGIEYKVAGYDDTKLFLVDKLSLTDTAPKYDFYNCFCNHAHPALLMLRGKGYNCATTLHIQYFNEHFGTDFQIRDGDYVDIYNTTAEDIYRFKISRKPFCGYHNSANRSLMKWGLSERKIEEWVQY